MADDSIDAIRVCSKCGEVGMEFPPRGLQCQDCVRAASRRRNAVYRATNPDLSRARQARYREGHRDQLRASSDEYYRDNREKRYAWMAANQDKIRAYAAISVSRPDYREKHAARGLAYRMENAEKVRAMCAAYRKANQDKVRAYNAAYRASHQEQVHENRMQRRARLANAPVIETVRRESVWARDRGVCHLCGKKCDPKNWHLDHIVPLARGGEHSNRNVAVSHPQCNMSKGARGSGQPFLFSPDIGDISGGAP